MKNKRRWNRKCNPVKKEFYSLYKAEVHSRWTEGNFETFLYQDYLERELLKAHQLLDKALPSVGFIKD